MQDVITVFSRFIVGDDGQDLVEYGLLAVLIAVAVIFSLGVAGNTVNVILWQPLANVI
jgi:Flp pilus assembly pilin Flp